MAKKWPKFSYPDKAYAYDEAGLKKHWGRLHKGDLEPYPKAAAVREAWRAYHAGDFQTAVELGNGAGGAGVNAAVKAQMIYANYLEKVEKTKLALLQEAAGWADARRREAPKDPNAHYFYSYALGRYSQGISIGAALTQGHAAKVRDAQREALKLAPKHADAHIAHASFHAEVVAKVGGLIAGMTYGAKKDAAIEHFETAIKLFPESAIARVEYANGLALLFGKGRQADADRLLGEAAKCKPADAMERLDLELAKSRLA
jgi:tetratricopeptide (TPR) repeat protein